MSSDCSRGCDSGQHVVWNAAAREAVDAADAAARARVAALGWASATVPVAWGAEGVWPPRGAIAHVRALDRSPEGDVVAQLV